MGSKLTKPQLELLRETVGCCAVSETYAPANKLVLLGLAEWTHGDYGSTYLNITDAGRAALTESPKS